MTDKEEEKIYNTIAEFHKASQKLGSEARADSSAGGGIQTKEERDDFIQWFGGFVKKVNQTYDKAKNELNSVKH
jgi:flagellar hook-basal body complex protein FliE